MLKLISDVSRLIRAGWTLARHDAMFPAEYQAAFPAPARWAGKAARLIAIKGRADNPGERLAQALETLGPAYIKFGQVLATRSDVIGERFARGLMRLQDRLPPFEDAKARAILEKELGAPIESHFETLGPAIAAASIAQVHKARTTDGRDVAVKILRPDVERRIRRDIRALRLGAKLAERLYPKSKRLEPNAFVETVARSLTLELDLRLEAASASEIAEASAAADNFFIPEVDWPRTSKQVLTTSWIEAIPLHDIERMDREGVDKVKLAADLTDAFLTTALDRGVFHADLHGGNLFVKNTGQLWAVDFGIMGRLGLDERKYLAEILYGFLTKDYDRAAQAHFDAGYVPAHHSKADFASALRAVAEPIFGKDAANVHMSRVLLQLFEITELFDMHLQPQLVLLQKTMVQVEGVCRSLSASHNMWTASGPAVERFMRRELGPEGQIMDGLDDVRALRDAVRRLPQFIDDISDLAERARQNPPRELRTPLHWGWGMGLGFMLAAGLAGLGFWLLTGFGG